MNSTSEDFPRPVPPTRRIVCGAFALFFAVLMIASLRDSMSLNLVRTDASKMLLGLPGSRGVMRSDPAYVTKQTKHRFT